MKNKLYIATLGLAFTATVSAQVITREDSLNAGLVRSDRQTVISGYGEVSYNHDFKNKTATANLNRAIVFIGHKFTNKVALFTETEIEDGKVDGSGGEVSLEQAFIKMNASNDLYFTAGLFIPRIGIINENHLPTTYSTVWRPNTERYIIPSTWREIGVGVYYSPSKVPGLNLSASLVNGLDASGLGHGKTLREARYEGRDASASNVALNAAVLYYFKNFRFQASGYYGGAGGNGVNTLPDSVKLKGGGLGTPVSLFEANVQYRNKGLYVTALYSQVNITDAKKINLAYNNNAPLQAQGYYVEAGYNIFQSTTITKKLNVFGRYEHVDPNHKTVEASQKDLTLNKEHYFFGLNYFPTQGVVIKADFEHVTTGMINPAQLAPNQTYNNATNYLHLGIGYSF